MLGCMFAHGLGAEKNLETARQWFARAESVLPSAVVTELQSDPTCGLKYLEKYENGDSESPAMARISRRWYGGLKWLFPSEES